MENGQVFEARKSDHITASMDPSVQSGGGGFERFSFVHEALPEIDFSEVSIASKLFVGAANLGVSGAIDVRSPFFISSMTAGHGGSLQLNEIFARAAEHHGWAMGVGSQRRELHDPESAREWAGVRKRAPRAILFGNIGLSQLIEVGPDKVLKLVDSLEASALIVHLNPLQEALQMEGTPNFRGGLNALEGLSGLMASRFKKPVIVKETGCGISATTAEKLFRVGVSVVDVAGRGGTHWGRIEGWRSRQKSGAGSGVKSPDQRRQENLADAAESFRNWGITTAEALEQVTKVAAIANGASGGSSGREGRRREVWASGGVRSGVDGAKALKLGATAVGFAQPILAAALLGEERLLQVMERFDYELKTVLFCSGAKDLESFVETAQMVSEEPLGVAKDWKG